MTNGGGVSEWFLIRIFCLSCEWARLERRSGDGFSLSDQFYFSLSPHEFSLLVMDFHYWLLFSLPEGPIRKWIQAGSRGQAQAALLSRTIDFCDIK